VIEQKTTIAETDGH